MLSWNFINIVFPFCCSVFDPFSVQGQEDLNCVVFLKASRGCKRLGSRGPAQDSDPPVGRPGL